ncbi:MAG TPA: 5'-deoxynucleotidase [Firmicutes bacterium]|nr:5'-deoxynucleotidase [Bacillota bacterium]
MEKFYAYLDRMKFIRRWQLMRSTRDENIMEHSHQVAVLTHALVSIENDVYGGHVDAGKAVLYALYHEVGEVMTGDMPTPVKYFNGQLHGEYAKVEQLAVDKIAATLPDELKGSVYPYLQADKASEEYAFVKAADKLSAYLKCLEELRSGNSEFVQAEKTIGKALREKKMRAVDYFFEHFIPAFSLTLDELS